MSFDIRDYLDQLEPYPGTKGAFLCPACGGGKLTYNKQTGAYSSHTCDCARAEIREALSPACNPNTGLTQTEREERKRANAAKREQQVLETARIHAETAKQAQREWDAAVPLTEAASALVEASYWTRKGLEAIADVRIVVEGHYRGWVLLPMYLPDGTLQNVQRIHPTRTTKKGGKQNVKGGQSGGCIGIFGDLSDATVVAIAEGPATAGSIHQLTGWPTLIGFGHSDFPTAAAMARGKAPDARLVICADNDEKGAGQRSAAAVARDYRGVVVMPPNLGQDFNDMHQAEGDDVTRALLLSALEAEPVEAEPEVSVAETEADVEASEEFDLGEALEQLRQLQETQPGPPVLSLSRRMVEASADLSREDADYWLKAIAKVTSQRVSVLRTTWQSIVTERAAARAAERQARLEAAQQRALETGRLDPRLANRFLPIRVRDTDAGLELFEDDGWLTLVPGVDLGLASMRHRKVHLCWDADVFDPQVLEQLKDKAMALAATGAVVRVEVLPRCPETGRALTAAEVADRYGRQFLQRLPQLARNCWKENRDGTRDFRLEPDAEDTVQRSGYVVGMIGDRLAADPDLSQAWLSYTGTHWQLHSHDRDIRSRIHTLAEAQGWHRGREFGAFNSLMADVTRALTRQLPPRHTGLVPLQNGLLDLTNWQLLPHSPEYGNRWCLPYDYNPTAMAEPVVEFLAERLGGRDRLRLFQAWLALLLRGIRPKQFVELVGESDTGKSTICNLVAALIGPENTVSTDLQRLEDKSNRFETYKLCGKLLAIIAEAHKYHGPVEVLKSVTGGDLISAEIKGSTGAADFYFEGGVLIAGNGSLYASDSSDAVMKRRITFTLGRVTGPRRELLQWNPSRRCWEGEFVPYLPGLFNWALSMSEVEARQVLEHRHQNQALREQDYQTLIDQDPLLAWADVHLIASPGRNLRIGDADGNADLYAFPNYRRHSERQGVRNPLTGRTFRKTLVSRLRSLGADLPDDERAYRLRGQGAIIPGIDLRQTGDITTPSLIQALMLNDPESADAGTDTLPGGMDHGTAETQSGHGWNGWNGFSGLTRVEVENNAEPGRPDDPGTAAGQRFDEETRPIGGYGEETVPPVPSIPCREFSHSAAIPDPFPSVPDGSNPWGLPPEQVAIAHRILTLTPRISDLSFEVHLARAGIRVESDQVKPLRQWLSGEVA